MRAVLTLSGTGLTGEDAWQRVPWTFWNTGKAFTQVVAHGFWFHYYSSDVPYMVKTFFGMAYFIIKKKSKNQGHRWKREQEILTTVFALLFLKYEWLMSIPHYTSGSGFSGSCGSCQWITSTEGQEAKLCGQISKYVVWFPTVCVKRHRWNPNRDMSAFSRKELFVNETLQHL